MRQEEGIEGGSAPSSCSGLRLCAARSARVLTQPASIHIAIIRCSIRQASKGLNVVSAVCPAKPAHSESLQPPCSLNHS